MTADASTPDAESSSHGVCRVCHTNVGSGAFCGNCGTGKIRRRRDGPDWLRGSAYAPAPDTGVLRPTVTTTLFPRLPRSSRTAFAAGLLLVTLLLVGCAAARWQPPLIGLVTLGLPILFVLYLRATDAFADLSRVVVLGGAVLSVALGVGWAIATNAAIARADDDALGLPVSATRIFVTGLGIPLSFLLLLLAPTIIIRWLRPGPRESLNGFVIGSLIAFAFTGAAQAAQLAPDLATGLMVTADRSPVDLIVAAAIQGLAVPLTAAAIGGAVGATLWFSPRTDSARTPWWYLLTSPVLPVGFGVAVYLGSELLDYFSPPEPFDSGSYVLIAVLALYLQRLVVHSTVLREMPDPARPDASVRCPQCEHSVPDLPFCPTCGAAARAALRTTRQNTTPDEASAASPVRSASPTRLLLALGVCAVLIAGATVGLALWLRPPTPSFICPPDCGRPPIAEPVLTNPRFTPDSGEFSVSYPGEATAYTADFEPNGVILELHAGDGGTLRLFGEPAAGRTPKQIATDLISDAYPDAETEYEIPNAMVGYQLGYGEVADVYPADSIGDEARTRVLVMVAVKNDYALVAAAAGAYHEFGPDFGSGHPSGANFFLALDMSKYVNSFTWRGDALR